MPEVWWSFESCNDDHQLSYILNLPEQIMLKAESNFKCLRLFVIFCRSCQDKTKCAWRDLWRSFVGKNYRLIIRIKNERIIRNLNTLLKLEFRHLENPHQSMNEDEESVQKNYFSQIIVKVNLNLKRWGRQKKYRRASSELKAERIWQIANHRSLLILILKTS